jgi:hypothetical protein
MSRIKKIITAVSRSKILVFVINKLFFTKLSSLFKSENGKCYIFGNGWSLKGIDHKQFQDAPIIACNFHFLIKSEIRLIPKYYIHLEKMSELGKAKEIFRNYFRNYIFKQSSTKFFIHFFDYLNLRNKNLFFLLPFGRNWYPAQKEFEQLFDARNVPLEGSLRSSLNLAIYLGFSEVVLVGHDYLMQPTRAGHFYEKGIGEEIYLENWNLDFLNTAKKFINIRIIGFGEPKFGIEKMHHNLSSLSSIKDSPSDLICDKEIHSSLIQQNSYFKNSFNL